MGYTEVRQADIQVDIYGDSAGDRAIALETTFSSSYAYDKIKSLDARLAPLYSSPAIQAPMINAESQWQERYMLTLSCRRTLRCRSRRTISTKQKLQPNRWTTAHEHNPFICRF